MTGKHVTVTEGPFENFSGTIVRERGDSVVVKLEIFGRTTEVTLTRAQVSPLTLEGLEAQVVEAVARRGFRQRLFNFWEDEVLRTPQRSQRELAASFAEFEAQVLREQDAAQQEALERFRAEYQPLEDAARVAKWQKDKEAWTSWRDQARALSDAREAKVFGALEGEARLAEIRRVREAAYELQSNVELWQRRQALAQPNSAEPRNEALEAEIERDLDRDEPYLVYADWLLSHGNRRGELISLAGKPQELPLRKQLAPQLLGGLLAVEDRLEPKWRLGFLESLELEATRADEAAGIDVLKLIETALGLTSTRFLRDLTIACPSVHEEGMASRLSTTLAAGGVRPSLRSLSFITNEEEEMLSWTSAGELGGYAQLFPNLRSLHVHAGGFSLTQPRFPKLRTLVLRTCGLSAESLQAIIDADWPELERLELWFGSANYGVHFTVEQVLPLLRSGRLPRLRSLGLCNCEFTDALSEALLSSPLLPQLRSVSLAKGTMTDAGANVLRSAASKLSALEELDVDDNYLSAEALEALRAVLPVTRSEDQREAEAYQGALHRYASVGE